MGLSTVSPHTRVVRFFHSLTCPVHSQTPFHSHSHPHPLLNEPLASAMGSLSGLEHGISAYPCCSLFPHPYMSRSLPNTIPLSFPSPSIVKLALSIVLAPLQTVTDSSKKILNKLNFSLDLGVLVLWDHSGAIHLSIDAVVVEIHCNGYYFWLRKMGLLLLLILRAFMIFYEVLWRMMCEIYLWEIYIYMKFYANFNWLNNEL